MKKSASSEAAKIYQKATRHSKRICVNTLHDARPALCLYHPNHGEDALCIRCKRPKPSRPTTPARSRDRLQESLSNWLSPQSKHMLGQLAKLGIYGSTSAEVAARFIDSALQRFSETKLRS